MTPSGRNTGAAANKEGRETRSGVFAAPPSGLVIGTPPHAGVGKAAAWSNRANRTDDMVAPWDEPIEEAASAKSVLEYRVIMQHPMSEFVTASSSCAVFSTRRAAETNLKGQIKGNSQRTGRIEVWRNGHKLDAWQENQLYDATCGMTPKDEWFAEALKLISTDWVARMYAAPGGTLKARLTPAILPQDVPDNTAALEAIALKDAKTDTKVALNNAVMAELGKVVEGTNRCLKVAQCFLQARGLEVYLCHRQNAAGIVVGTSLTDGDPVRPVFRMADLERFLVSIGDKAETPEPALLSFSDRKATEYAIRQCEKLVALYTGRYQWLADVITPERIAA